MASDSIFWTISLFLQDKEFLEEHWSELDPLALPDGPLRKLSHVIVEQFKEYGRALLTQPGLRAGIADLPEEDQDEIIAAHHDLLTAFTVDDESRERVRAVALLFLKRSSIGHALDTATEALSTGDEEAALEALAMIQQQRFERMEQIDLSKPEHFDQLVPDDWSESISTGIPALDRMWEGGLHPHELAIIMAPTNVGKSMAVAFFAAMAYLSDKRVVVHTYELPPKEMTRRILAAIFQCPIRSINDPSELRGAMAELAIGYPNASLLVIRGDDTIADLGTRIDQMEKIGKKPDLIILDSADDMKPSRATGVEWQDLGKIYRDLLIEICQKRHVAVWTTTQASKDALDKARIQLRQIGNAYEKAKRAMLILGMAQGPGQLNDPLGPIVTMFVLKDSLHGSRHKWFDTRVKFGEGFNGWPGYEVVLGTGTEKDVFE